MEGTTMSKGLLLAIMLVIVIVSAPVDAHGRGGHMPKSSKYYSPGYGTGSSSGLSDNYYDYTCPGGVDLISQLVSQIVAKDNTMPAALIRLQFHDCFVNGCDASVLINGTDPNTEIHALPNRGSLRGLDVLETIKTAVEAFCPGVVSCADIIALASRDSIQAIGGPYWDVPLGRRDGLVSSAAAASAALPSPFSNFSTILQQFQAVGLNSRDMTILSGGHTIGFAHCNIFRSRLVGDPTLNQAYAAQLIKECPAGQNNLVPMDPTFGGQKFDSLYYEDLLQKKGLFISDNALLTNPASAALVQVEALSPEVPFFLDFAWSMQKMGNIGVLTGPQGQIRKVCSAFNS